MKSTVRDAAFAMEFAEDAPPFVRNVVAVSWTTDVLRVLRQIRDEATTRAKEDDEDAFIHLPFANLRAQLHLEIDDWAAVKDDIGLRSLYVPSGDPEAWGFLDSADPRGTVQKVKDAFARWSEGPLARYSEGRGAHALGISELRRLNQNDKVVRVSPSRVQIFPWGAITKPGAPTPFDVTAGVLAARLAGKELFPELGPVVRVMGGSDHNSAEVMTRPHDAAGGRFQSGLRDHHGNPARRQQTDHLLPLQASALGGQRKQGYAASSSIGGFVFPHAARPRSAYRFSVIRRARKWATDLGYPQFEYEFGLTPGHEDERVLAYPCDERASVVVMQKAEVTDSRSALQAGVPLVDQADAFERIAAALNELGLRPFTGFKAVKAAAVKAPALSMLKAEVTLARLLERHSRDDDDESSTEDALGAATAVPADRWFNSEVPVPDANHDQVIAAIRALTADTAYADDKTRQTMYVVSQVPEDIEWIKTTASAMLGDAIKVVSVALPANTHGPKQQLPGENDKTKQRFDLRTRAWQKFALAVGIPERAMVLVQAPMFYPVDGGKVKPDDNVNKLAARKTMAGQGCTVQYLLPSEHGRLDKFLPRVQAALLDLVFGHAGSVWGLKQACAACFSDASPAPRWVAAIGSLYVHPEWGNDRPQSVFVATRLECATGQAWVRFAHKCAEAVQSGWMRFDVGAKYLVAGRIELPRARLDQRALLAQFFESTFDELAALDPNALVFIDSTRAAKLASWLSDPGVRDEKRLIAPGISASQRWPTLRLLRIREQAPAIGQEKLFEATAPDGSALRTWTSTQRLFQVSGTAAPTFWSLARPSTHHKRGASCYREKLLPNSHKTQEKPDDFIPFPAQPDKQHLNSRAVEVVVLQKQPGDGDIQLASFAQHLRAGMLTARNERWVTTPSPLRIIDKLAEYMKA